jgi:hypothetical protein
MSQWRHRQTVEKRQKSIDIIHVLTIRKRVKKNSHLWTSMIFVISANNMRVFALIDNDFNQNFIDQRFAYEWCLNADENSSTDSQTVNETFLRMFKSHSLKFSSKKNDERVLKIEQNLMSIHMIEGNVILKMSWLKKINSIVNWSTNRWRFKKNFKASSNKSRDAADQQKSKYFKKTNDFYIIQMNWSKLQFNLFESKAFAFAILFNVDSKKERLLIVIQKTDENNYKINNEISFQYFAF